jgi:chromosome segregation ATPase
VNAERADDADDLATMLVRIADAERAKAASALLAHDLGERVTALEAELSDLKDAPRPTDPQPRVADLSGELDAARLRLGEVMGIEARLRTRADELEQQLAESLAMTNALKAQVGAAAGDQRALQNQLQAAEQAVQMATSRAGLAEQSAADGAAALERARAELEADRARAVDLETKVARMKREHADAMEAQRRELANAVESVARERVAEVSALEAKHADALRTRERGYEEATTSLREESARMLAALRLEHAGAVEENRREHAAELDTVAMSHGGELQALAKQHDALAKQHDEALKAIEQRHAHTISAMREEHSASKRSAGRVLEEERSAAARARQQVVALEATVTSMRATMARATQLLDELARREETASSARVQAIEHAKHALAGEGNEATADRAATTGLQGPRPRSASQAVSEPTADRGSLDEIEIDLAD